MTYPGIDYPKLILASASPRREQLLKQIGLEFEVMPSDFDESRVCMKNPDDSAQRAALEKARFVAKQLAEGIVIGADTIVVYAEEAMGKPKDQSDAIRILKRLSGKRHEVITGVALVKAGNSIEYVWSENTSVWFRQLSDMEIKEYVEIERPMDKAGAYGIQGRAAAFVKRIEGCYFNVVGLPLASLVEKLKLFVDKF
ncbi:TPA: septum formation inhibitor Maf [Candidatus Poribacteria bacterium]|nr:septum formation inhibitor Maf [Candidatus Poribacteria bacterium]